MIADDEHDTARSGEFDPRYDPAFQRGYLPQPGERTRTRVRSGSAVPAAPARDPRRTASSSRDRWDDAVAAGVYDAPEPSAADAVAVAGPAPDIPALEALPQPAIVVAAPPFLSTVDLSPRRNPLMLALWIVGAGLFVLGIVVYALSVNASYTNTSQGTDVGALVFAQVGWVLGGPMVTIGLATLVALLFLTALAGRRRSTEQPDDDEG